jgi:hypothetical protein
VLILELSKSIFAETGDTELIPSHFAKRVAINIVETKKNRLFIITPIKSCPHNLQIK